ncbi:MAG: G8 domain-containing protein [Pseudomonadota bacterium]
MHEHEPALALVDHADATHVAVSSGSWFDPATWADGIIPGDDARVLISSDVTVRYDDVSDARLFTVRVDGELDFAPDQDTRMVVDTIVVDPAGKLTIGTEDDPVQASFNSEIVFANNGAIDVNWDPNLLSRGLVALGEVEIHGQEKTSHHKVSVDPMAGDTSLTLAELPTNWAVGDVLVIAGSEYEGYRWDNEIRAVRHYESEDETVTITAIDGGTITFDPPLAHDHDSPREDLKISVANYSRNVTFSTENAETADIHERGHVMFHSAETDVRYAAFDQLGRTDKSEAAMAVSAFDTIESDSNVQGRYSVHFHRTGVDDPENPAYLVGNSVYGSPGWGIVHHDSNAIVHNNATYDTFGAGYVSETGNEIGVWSDNIAIFAQGVGWGNPKNMTTLSTFDTGRSGDGFWFQSRLVKSDGNIAASVNNGFVYFHRGSSTVDGSEPGNIRINANSFELPEALASAPVAGIDDAPVTSFSNNEAFAARSGVFVVKANPNQQHDIHSKFQDFTAWNVANGGHFEYTSHYIISNFDVVARESRTFVGSTDGISFGPNVSDMTVIDLRAEGFDRSGVNLLKSFTNDELSFDAKKLAVVGGTFIDNGVDLYNYDPEFDIVIDLDDHTPLPFEVNLEGQLTYREGYPDPGARRVEILGEKTDGVGTISIPAGTDNYSAGMAEVIRILEKDGWWETTSGERVFFLEDYYSDRLTGEIYKVALPVFIDDNVPLGSQYFSYTDAKYNGIIDLDHAAPVAEDEIVDVSAGVDTIIDLTGNDSDPEGASIILDGVVQPLHGQIFDNGDGTVTYRPFLDYTGTETVKYWVTDGAGKYSEAFLTINVTAEDLPDDPPVDDEPADIVQLGTMAVTQMSADSWTEVSFDAPIEDAVVVMGPLTVNGGQPATIRVRNVTDQGFEFQIDEWEYLDGSHIEEQVSWMAASEGHYNLEDGRQIAFGRELAAGTGETSVELDGFDEDLVAFAQVASANDEDAVTTRLSDVGPNGFDISLQEQEASDGSRQDETVHWVAIEEGSSELLTAMSLSSVTHQWQDIDGDLGVHFFADMQTLNGANTATVRQQLDGDGSRAVRIEEEKSLDQETWHIAEEVGLFSTSADWLELFT